VSSASGYTPSYIRRSRHGNMASKSKRAAKIAAFRKANDEWFAEWKASHPIAMYEEAARNEPILRKATYESARSRVRYLANLEVNRAKARLWHQIHPEKSLIARAMWRQRRRMGINRAKRRAAKWARPTATPEEISAIKSRQKGKCFYCHAKTKLTLDHVIPLSKNGSNTAENLVFACVHCNLSKGARIWRLC